MARGIPRWLPLSALVAGSIAALLVLLGGGSGHSFSVVVPAATNLLPGNEISAAGRKIGTVSRIEPVDRGRAARIVISIDDARYWPLPRDSKLAVRFGGTVSAFNRYLLLERGKRGAPIPDGGELPAANVTTPVEVDTVVSHFTPPLRRDLRRMIGTSAGLMSRAGPDLHRAIGKAPPVVAATAGLFRDLTGDRQRLETLVSSAGRVVDGVHHASPDLRALLDGAARTFDAIADESDDLKVSLDRLPAALRQTRGTLRRADVTLREARVLTGRLAPGAVELRRAARPLTGVLAGLRDVAPGARKTLRAVDASDITATALGRVAGITPRIGSVGRKAAKELGCLRPYAPEIALFGSVWGDWFSGVDDRDHLARATIQSFLPGPSNSSPYTPEDAVKANPGLEYAFPRPPGLLAGQPWFQPQCGAGPDALDPSKDQEAAHYRAGRGVRP